MALLALLLARAGGALLLLILQLLALPLPTRP